MPQAMPAIGARVSLKTSKGEALAGTVFTVDDKVLVLEQFDPRLSDTKATYQLINRAGISELQELSAPPSRAADFEASELPDVNLEIVEKRMERAVDKAAGEAKKTNSKVNIRSQKIFNELSKTMPCEWYEQGDLHCMLVYDAVFIRPPYGPNEIVAKKGETALEDRVKKVLMQIVAKVIGAEQQAVATAAVS